MKKIFSWDFSSKITLIIISSVAIAIVFSWIFFAGPNIDTLLTYHRNYIAHSFAGMFQILANQDQAPLPQLIDYILFRLGFTGVVALQAISSLLIIAAILWVFLLDLSADKNYLKLSQLWRLRVYCLGSIAIIISSSLDISLTWVRYAPIVGLLWYAVWTLQEKLLTIDHQLNHRRYAFILGLLVGIGPLVSYTWGVVVIALFLSLLIRCKLSRFVIRNNILLGLIPGILLIITWFIYAGTSHIDLILLRTHARATTLIKLIGEGYHLLTYPFIGALLFPGIINILALLMNASTIGLAVIIFLRTRHDLILPFIFYTLLPIPFFLFTGASPGYGMIGPGLIILTIAIKGILQFSSKRAILLSIFTFSGLVFSLVANLQGINSMSSYMFSNKSRKAVHIVLIHLLNKHALNNRTLVIAGDECAMYLVEKYLPNDVSRRYISDQTISSAPNIEAMLQFKYRQDKLTTTINRVTFILIGSETSNAIQKQMHSQGFMLDSFYREVGPYSYWYRKVTSNKAPAQYIIEEWVRK